MELTVLTDNNKAAKLEVADSVFSVKYNEPLIHQVLSSFIARSHPGTKAQRSRSEVRGGGRKPWRQKGTGRARAGTIRSPIWRGGGVTFAAKPRNCAKKVNKKMYRAAMRSILSELLRQKRLICVDQFDVNQPKTKLVRERLVRLDLQEALILTDEASENLYLGARNIPRVNVIAAARVDPYSLVRFNCVLITRAAVKRVEALLS